MTESNDDTEFISSLAALLKAHGLAEIEVSRVRGKFDKLNIRVAGRQANSPGSVPRLPGPAGQQPVAHEPGPAPLPGLDEPDAGPSPGGSGVDEEIENHPGLVRSPMIGTVYLTVSPEGPQFVEIGQMVSEGDTLVIVEAMKTMNHIPSPRAGTIKRVLVQNSEPVEYGTPIMIID